MTVCSLRVHGFYVSVPIATIRERQDQYLRRHYGIGLTDYNATLKKQRSRCHNCGARAPGGGRRYFSSARTVEDDGLVLLCRECSLALEDIASPRQRCRFLVPLDDYTEVYSLACDAIARAVFGFGVSDDGLRHTSSECRRIANDVLQAIGLEAEGA